MVDHDQLAPPLKELPCLNRLATKACWAQGLGSLGIARLRTHPHAWYGAAPVRSSSSVQSRASRPRRQAASRHLIAAMGLVAAAASAGCPPSSSYSLPIPRIRVSDRWEPRPPAVTQTVSPLPSFDNAAPRGWVPTRGEVPGRWQGILIHHTDTERGSAATIDKYHRNTNGWDCLGYHFLIANGRGQMDGKIEVGPRWPVQREGAHCRVSGADDNYWNEHTIGIALVGQFEEQRPTAAQYRSLARLVHFLQQRYGIPNSKIKGHRDAEPTKCPGRHFSLARLRQLLGNQYGN